MAESIFSEGEELKIKELIQLVINETKKDFACVHHCEVRHMKIWGAMAFLFFIIVGVKAIPMFINLIMPG